MGKAEEKGRISKFKEKKKKRAFQGNRGVAVTHRK
jgi:hypothetical protein